MRLSELLLAGYLLLLPFQYETAGGMRLAPSDAMLVLYLLWGGRVKLGGSAWHDWHWALLGVMAMGLLVAQLRTGTISEYAVLQKFIGMGVLFTAYAAIVGAADSWGAIRRLSLIFVTGVVLQNLILLSFFMLSWVLGIHLLSIQIGDDRLCGFLYDPNAYGGVLALTFALLVTSEFEDARWKRWLYLVGVPSVILGLVMTFSRSSWIGVVATLSCLALLNPRRLVPIFVVSVLLGSLVLVLLPDHLAHRLAHLASRPDQVDARREIAGLALQLYGQYPVFGIGLGNFTRFCPQIVHNTALWFLTELGIIGLIVFAGFISTFLLWGWRGFRAGPLQQRKLVLGLLLGCLSMLGLSLGIEALYQRHWWFVMALIGASNALLQSQKALHAAEAWNGQALPGRVCSSNVV